MHLNREVEIYKDEEFVKKVIFKDIDENGNGILQSKNGHEKISSGQISIKGIY
jgi:biotin-(acetyl-CoA carboxylase) ligase